MFDNGNVNWCMLGRAFLCRTGHFCVEPGIFVSNHAFCCWTGLFLCRTSVIMYITPFWRFWPVTYCTDTDNGRMQNYIFWSSRLCRRLKHAPGVNLTQRFSIDFAKRDIINLLGNAHDTAQMDAICWKIGEIHKRALASTTWNRLITH